MIMKLGKKIPRECQKMKKWKNIISLKTMLVILGLILVIVSMLIVKNIEMNTKNALEILENQRFVFVQEPDLMDMYGKKYGEGFDLREKAVYVPFGTVIKDDKVYSTVTNEKAEPLYERIINYEFSSALLNSNITIGDIKKSNYQVILNPEDVVNKKMLNQEYVPDLELVYSLEKSEFKKIRISYNKDFLPTKIEWYYKKQGKGKLKWYTWRTYSYPFKSQEEFDRKLKKEIETIEEINYENTGD